MNKWLKRRQDRQVVICDPECFSPRKTGLLTRYGRSLLDESARFYSRISLLDESARWAEKQRKEFPPPRVISPFVKITDKDLTCQGR